MNLKRFLLTVFITVVILRSLTYLAILTIGHSGLWKTIYEDRWNHYQLGAVIVVTAFLFKGVTAINKHFLFLIAIGTGMMIDEVTDILKLFKIIAFPLHYRDSFQDLMLIIITFIFFSTSVLLGAFIQHSKKK